MKGGKEESWNLQTLESEPHCLLRSRKKMMMSTLLHLLRSK